MVKRSYNQPETEPDTQKQFPIPSEKEHLFQVVDVITFQDELGVKFGLDENTVTVKLEVVGGDEAGRNVLQRLSLDDNWKGFFSTRLFLKAIGEPYKGVFDADTDNWIGKQIYATIKHVPSKDGKKTFPNIDNYNYDKVVYNKSINNKDGVKELDDIKWGD